MDGQFVASVFDAFLAEHATKPNNVMLHPNVVPWLLGAHPAVQCWYARWYNARNKWRKISTHRRLTHPQQQAAGRTWMREGPLQGGLPLGIRIETYGGHIYADGEVLMRAP